MDIIGGIVALGFFCYLFYKENKRKKLKEDSEKSLIKTSEYLQKISENTNNNFLLERIEKLEQEVKELKNK